MLSYQSDWRIIALQKQYRKLTQSYDLQGPVWIGDSYYQFEQESLFDDKLIIYLPTQFMDLPEAAAREKYPSVSRSQIIKTNEDMTVNFTFSYLGENESPLTPEALWAEIERLFPSSVLYDTGTLKKENLEVFWLEYKSFSVEDEVYNILFPIVIGGADLIIGAFNCPITQYDIWKPCVLQIIMTMQTRQDEEDHHNERL